jgi:hypothetical protein
MLHMFHTYVACVLFGCCVWLQWFLSVFQGCFSSVSETCFKCFNCLQTYVSTVVFGYLKSRSCVASLLLPPYVASRGWEQRRRRVVTWGTAVMLSYLCRRSGRNFCFNLILHEGGGRLCRNGVVSECRPRAGHR